MEGEQMEKTKKVEVNDDFIKKNFGKDFLEKIQSASRIEDSSQRIRAIRRACLGSDSDDMTPELITQIIHKYSKKDIEELGKEDEDPDFDRYKIKKINTLIALMKNSEEEESRETGSLTERIFSKLKEKNEKISLDREDVLVLFKRLVNIGNKRMEKSSFDDRYIGQLNILIAKLENSEVKESRVMGSLVKRIFSKLNGGDEKISLDRKDVVDLFRNFTGV